MEKKKPDLIVCVTVAVCEAHDPNGDPCKCVACYPDVYAWAVRAKCDTCGVEVFAAPSSINYKRAGTHALICKKCLEVVSKEEVTQYTGVLPNSTGPYPWDRKPQ